MSHEAGLTYPKPATLVKHVHRDLCEDQREPKLIPGCQADMNEVEKSANTAYRKLRALVTSTCVPFLWNLLVLYGNGMCVFLVVV